MIFSATSVAIYVTIYFIVTELPYSGLMYFFKTATVQPDGAWKLGANRGELPERPPPEADAQPLERSRARKASRPPVNLWLGIPLSLSGFAIVPLFVIAGPQWVVFASALLLMGAGYFAGRLLHTRHARGLASAQSDAACAADRATGLCAKSAPVWIRQIETARAEADSEITELARVFGNITRKLDKVMRPSRLPGSNSETPDEVLAALEQNGTDLEAIIAALARMQTSKEQIVGDIGVEAARLKDNAAEIKQIALQARVVALNATIEAARAGQAGKPFAVIVADMRDLATRSAEASERFSRHSHRLHGMVHAAFQEQTAGAGSVASIPWARKLAEQVVARFQATTAQLTRSIDAMEHERHDVRDDISRVLVSLQFQDRVSQILAHVSNNLEAMRADIAAGRWVSMDDRQWMQRMAETYSTSEEFGNHNAQPHIAVRPGSEVTFF